MVCPLEILSSCYYLGIPPTSLPSHLPLSTVQSLIQNPAISPHCQVLDFTGEGDFVCRQKGVALLHSYLFQGEYRVWGANWEGSWYSKLVLLSGEQN